MTAVAATAHRQRMKAVRRAEQAGDHPDALSGKAEQAVALVAHALFSATGGAAYGLTRGRLAAAAKLPAPVAGVVFGLAVWAAAFQGTLPALGVMRRTTDHQLERWPAPLMGRSVLGLVCGVVTEKVRPHLTP
jgi:hypothetical protein